ncbi:DUF6192 family protein [Streptomyces sp. NPDC057686]|uniref:DUF6192 family protein n=1 Tax=Streptomyces sp. NPDC057686 TaxID=3346212 RepID=UPI0036B9E77A
MPAQTRSADRIGSVSIYRYEQIVAELRRPLEPRPQAQFAVGDRALEIEPMREPGYRENGEDHFTVRESLLRLAEDTGLAYSSVRSARWTASKWPAQHRCASASFMVHRILASIENEEERFTAILNLPTGKKRWTADEANRRTGRQAPRPVTPQEDSALHTVTQGEEPARAPVRPSQSVSPPLRHSTVVRQDRLAPLR